MSASKPAVAPVEGVLPLQDVLDRFPLGIGFIDASGNVIYRNRCFDELLPAYLDPEEEEPEHLTLTRLRCFEAPELVTRFLADLRSGRAQDIRCSPSGRSESGRDRVLRIRGMPLGPAANGGVMASLLVEDVSDAERLRRHLNQAQRMESIGSLASAVAHDFNNILTAIISSVHLMKANSEADERLARPLETIEKTALSAGQLAEQLLTLSRTRAAEPRELDVDAVISDARPILERVLKEDITLEISLEAGKWAVLAESSQIMHTLVNLCLNAQDAMSGRGTITISTRIVSLNGGRVDSNLPPGDYVLLAVSDHGRGISADIVERVFDPFFTTKENGTGLGLATAYSFAHEQGGTVTIYSEEGQGTTVNVYLKASRNSVQEKAVGEKVPGEMPRGTETLLLVDDEPLLVELGKELLTMSGYDVLTAHSGEEAMEVYEGHGERIPLVILDMAMPGMGGLETIRCLRARDPDIKIILSSGLHPSGKMAELLGPEVDAFMNKPYEVDHLTREVRRLLDT